MAAMRTDEVIVDISRTIGAPSPTAVAMMKELPDEEASVAYFRAIYPNLRKHDVRFTKCLLLAPGPDPDRYHCRFLQLERDDSDEAPGTESGLDCINSIVAACYTIMRLRNSSSGPVLVENVATGLVVAIHPEDGGTSCTIEASLPPGSPDAFVIPVSHDDAAVLALRVNNPYVIFDGRGLGLTPDQLLACSGRPDDSLRRRFEVEARKVRTYMGIEPGRNVPKIAVLFRDGRTLYARTIYRGEWHPGLPLTGLISLVVSTLITSSPWHEADRVAKELEVVGKGDTIRVSLHQPASPTQGAAVRVAARRIVNYVQDVAVPRR